MPERSEKLSERIPLNLTEEEFVDLARMAQLEERSVGEFIRLRIVRPFMYGTVRRIDAALSESSSGFGGLTGPER